MSLRTEHVLVDAQNPDALLIARAAKIVRAGGLVVFPTETVYGLGADALNKNAVEKIFVAKQRPASDPLIVHIDQPSQLQKLTTEIPEQAKQLIQVFWPGALSLVFKKHAQVPNNATAGGNTVAVRMPNHAVALALIAAAQTPIAAPSANLFSRPSPTNAKAVLEDLDSRFDFLLDAGQTQIGVESTVLSLLGPATLLRPGGVALEDIEKIIGPVLLPAELDDAQTSESQIPQSPGQMLKHYAPDTQLQVLHGPSQQVLTEMHVLSTQKKRVGLLLSQDMQKLFLELFPEPQAEIFSLGPDETSAAQKLFIGLRELDKKNLDVMLAHGFTNTGLGRALNDRLYRASQGKVREL